MRGIEGTHELSCNAPGRGQGNEVQEAVQAENKEDHTCQVSGDQGSGSHNWILLLNFIAKAVLLCRLREAWRETELLHHCKRVRHDGVFEDFAVTDGVDVDRHPLDAISRAGTSEELPAMRTTKRSTITTLSPSATTS